MSGARNVLPHRESHRKSYWSSERRIRGGEERSQEELRKWGMKHSATMILSHWQPPRLKASPRTPGLPKLPDDGEPACLVQEDRACRRHPPFRKIGDVTGGGWCTGCKRESRTATGNKTTLKRLRCLERSTPWVIEESKQSDRPIGLVWLGVVRQVENDEYIRLLMLDYESHTARRQLARISSKPLAHRLQMHDRKGSLW
jgi:hypothetical protein